MGQDQTMRAAVLTAPRTPFVVEDLPIPEPRLGEVLVRTHACGVCHTDLHVMNGDIAFPCPCVMGHEISGTVAALGPGVDHVAVGDRVVSAFIMPCGVCRFCVRGRDDLCEKFFALNRGKGALYDGTSRLVRADGTPLAMYSMAGLAEYCVVPATDVVLLPAQVDLTEAAIIGCAVFTAYGAVRHGADLRHGSTVAVYGVGGIGLNIVQLAKVFGAARVIAVDVADDKLTAARTVGAHDTVNGATTEAPAAVRELTSGEGADIVFDAVGSPRSFEQAFMSVRDGGRMLAVGLANVTATASVGITHLVRRGITIAGSYGARTRTDLPAVVGLVADGSVRLDQVITRRVSLEQAADTYAALDRGEIIGRAVVTMEDRT